jgi:hypothetical protein
MEVGPDISHSAFPIPHSSVSLWLKSFFVPFLLFVSL